MCTGQIYYKNYHCKKNEVTLCREANFQCTDYIKTLDFQGTRLKNNLEYASIYFRLHQY